MMSISPLKSAASASQYYLSEENAKALPDVSLEQQGGHYYLKEQSQGDPTFWHGKLAEQAGLLSQPVDQKTLESVLCGTLHGETIKGKRTNHKSGFDLTFSAPKNASILALVGGDERLIDAHNDAVRFALSELENDVAQVKTTKEKGVQTFDNTQSMIFAVVRHKTSRNNDPQLHSHALAANMTRDQQGELRALASCLKQTGGIINGSGERIYHFQKYYTALYQSHYAHRIQGLGYSIQGLGQGQFDIKGVPNSLHKAFSTRKQQIDQQVLEFGHNTQASRDTAALDTRQAKSYHSDATLNHKWQQTVKGQGLDPTLLVKRSQEAQPSDGVNKQDVQMAFSRAVAHLEQYSTALRLEKIIEMAATEFTNGKQQANAIDLKQVADDWIHQQRLVPLPEKGLYTTKSLLDIERALMTVTQGRRHHMRTNIDAPTLNALNITPHNRQKVANIYRSTKQFHVVNVYGSSEQLAQHLLNAGNHSGKRVQLVSQNAQHRQLNQRNVTRDSQTLSTWVKHLFEKERRHTLQGLLHSTYPLTNKDVLLIDCANKMSADELISVSNQAKRANCKVIFLNHVSSRQGMQTHNAMTLYCKGKVEQHSWLNDKHTDSHVRLYAQDTHRIADIYTSLPDKTQCQVLATSGVQQRRLTSDIRATLKNAGQLSRTSITLFTQHRHTLSKAQKPLAKHYQAGMMLRQWKNGKPVDFVIAEVDRAANTLETISKTDGKSHTFDPSSKTFQRMKPQVFKPGCLEISQGERILTTSKHRLSGLENRERYIVTDISNQSLTLTSHHGQSKTLALSQLKDAPLRYDYVHRVSQIEPKEHTLLSGKAFMLSNALLNELTTSSRRVDIFTDRTDKALQALDRAEIRPSAIERVLHHRACNDHLLSHSTESTLRRDIEQALNVLAKADQRPASEKAVRFALNHLSEQEAAYTQKALVIEAVRYAFEETHTPITKTHIEAELAKHSDTLSVQYCDGTRWTTQTALETEKHILSNIEQGKDQRPALASPKHVRAYLEGQPHLTNGQKDAIHLISTTKDSFVAIQGLAGTGKSTMLATNVALIERVSQVHPNHIIGLAPTHSAVSELENQGITAQTLASLLTDLRRGITTPTMYTNSLFFLDESSMVSNSQAQAFTDLVLASGSRAVLLGDKEQLLSLNAGKPFELAMSKGLLDSTQVINTAQMTDIIRQRNQATLGAVHNILDKQPDSAIEKLNQQAPDGQGKTQHVISTFEEHPQDRRKAQQIATEKLPYEVAQDYLSRTPQTRDNTLIIAYTNQERDAISAHIRHGLIKRQELGKENVLAPRLRSTGASGEELTTMMPYRLGLVLSVKPGQYATITHVDSEHGVVMIKDHDSGEERAFLPRHRDHKFTALFSVSYQPLSVQEKIVTRFTDRSRGIKANVVHRIIQASPQAIVAQTQEGQSLTIHPSQLKDGHWDYAYTRTADMAQGATYHNVITAIKGTGALTNLRRAYIDLTRASEHVRLYTDNPKHMMKSWLSKEVNKASAMETLKHISPQSTIYFNNTPLPHEDVRYHNGNGDFDYNKMRERIQTELPAYTESLATELLGQPNKTKSDRDYLTFGSGKTAIKVSLTGEYRGYFKDYTTGEKGSLINLIMNVNGISYKEAMAQAHRRLNAPEDYAMTRNQDHDKLINATPRHIAQFEQRAKDYWQTSQAIQGTLVERYLKQFGVEKPRNEQVRYHSAVYSSEDRACHPAMVTLIHNRDQKPRAVAITYLDHQGNKNQELAINPRVLGTKSKHLTHFHQGRDLNTTIISTGVEQSFIINQSTQGQYDIINVSHKNDIQNLSADEIRRHVIIVLTQQNQDLNPNNVEKIVEKFASSSIHFVTEENMVEQIQHCIDKCQDHQNHLYQSAALNDSVLAQLNRSDGAPSQAVQNDRLSRELDCIEPREQTQRCELNEPKHSDTEKDRPEGPELEP